MPGLLLTVLASILSILIFTVDLLSNADTNSSYDAGGVPYIAVVLSTLWLSGNKSTYLFAIHCSTLTLFGLFFSAFTYANFPWINISYSFNYTDDTSITILQRLLSIFAIWITAILTVQRKYAEKRTTLLSTLVESINNPIIGISPDGTITNWNKGATTLYGYSTEEILGENIKLLFPNSEVKNSTLEMINQIQEGKSVEPYEAIRQTKDQRLIKVIISIYPSMDENGRMFGISEIHDINKEGIKSVFQTKEIPYYYSCFISYSQNDLKFAKRLHADLQTVGVRCWFAPEDMKGGEKIYSQISEALKVNDKLLLVLSDSSMESKWVIHEIKSALRREQEENHQMLFPIGLTSFDKIQNWYLFDPETATDLGSEIRSYFIPDFSDWQNNEKYELAFKKLIESMKANDRFTS